MQRTLDAIFESREPQTIPINWVPEEAILAYGQNLGYITMTDYIDLHGDEWIFWVDFDFKTIPENRLRVWIATLISDTPSHMTHFELNGFVIALIESYFSG